MAAKGRVQSSRRHRHQARRDRLPSGIGLLDPMFSLLARSRSREAISAGAPLVVLGAALPWRYDYSGRMLAGLDRVHHNIADSFRPGQQQS